MTNQKTFKEKYKEIKIASVIGIIAGLVFILIAVIHITTDATDLPSIFCITFGFCFFIYSSILFFFYWKFNKYQQSQKTIPKSFQIWTGVFLIFSLTFYNSKEKNSRAYLLAKEWRFYILIWIFLCLVIVLVELYAIQQEKIFWLLINLLIFNAIWFVDIILMISIWKYHGTNSKLLKILTICTLNYRNYRLYKKIIKLNQNEKAAN